VKVAIRKAGGDPNRIGGSSGKGSERFNARGRGAKVVGAFLRERNGWKGPGFGPVAQSGPAELRERCILRPLEHHPLDQGGHERSL